MISLGERPMLGLLVPPRLRRTAHERNKNDDLALAATYGHDAYGEISNGQHHHHRKKRQAANA